ncbi:hypothetical protein AAEX37_01720 [Oligella sp. MSHR50489EDL]|uniref:hypothetical protein n=1 Tax=Oligella sp. MSHR50489EDL TaxID=3139409 RepID=UPI003D819832
MKEILIFLNQHAQIITIAWFVVSFLLRWLNNWFLKNKKYEIFNVIIPIALAFIPMVITYSFFVLQLPITHKSVIIICINICMLFMLLMSLSIEFDRFNARRIAKAKYGLFEIDHTELSEKDKFK